MVLREMLLYFQVIRTILLRQFTLKKACYENILGRHCFLKGTICLSVHQEVELSYFSCGLAGNPTTGKSVTNQSVWSIYIIQLIIREA